MKPIIVIVVTGISLISAIPLAHHSDIKHQSIKEVHLALSIKPVSKPITAPVHITAPVPTVQASVVQPAPTPIILASYTCTTYSSLFNQYNWNSAVAMAICQAESSGNPNAVSDTDDYGLMQIHQGLELYGSQIYNPAFNISEAYQKYLTQGWNAWTSYNDGVYSKYL